MRGGVVRVRGLRRGQVANGDKFINYDVTGCPASRETGKSREKAGNFFLRRENREKAGNFFEKSKKFTKTSENFHFFPTFFSARKPL